MDNWTNKFIMILDRAKLELHLIIKYVDDLNLIVETVKPGTTWNKVQKIVDWNQRTRNN